MNKGLIELYYGDGKGKTTCAIGLAVRAAGCGLNVRIFQFCKREPSGELKSLEKLANVKLRRADTDISKPAWSLSADEKASWAEAQQALFDEACEAAQTPEIDIVVLDEILAAINEGAVGDDELIYLMKRKYKGTELVLTGRDLPKRSSEIVELSDYVTEFKCVKHPYEKGIYSRRGIEY